MILWFLLKGLCDTCRVETLKINLPLLTIFICPFSHKTQISEIKVCLLCFQLSSGSAEDNSKMWENEQRLKRSWWWTNNTELAGILPPQREGNVERTVVCLLFSTSAFIWYLLECWNAAALAARRCTSLWACGRSCAWRHWSILLLNALW